MIVLKPAREAPVMAVSDSVATRVMHSDDASLCREATAVGIEACRYVPSAVLVKRSTEKREGGVGVTAAILREYYVRSEPGTSCELEMVDIK